MSRRKTAKARPQSGHFRANPLVASMLRMGAISMRSILPRTSGLISWPAYQWAGGPIGAASKEIAHV